MFTLKSILLIFIISFLIDRAHTQFVENVNDLLPIKNGNDGKLNESIQKPGLIDKLGSFINQKLSSFDDLEKSEESSVVSAQKFSNSFCYSLHTYNTLHLTIKT